MASIYVSNLVVNSGSHFTQAFVIDDPDSNSSFDLTGYNVSSQMRKWAGSSSATNFTAEVGFPASEGVIILSLTADQTSALKPGRYVYDVVISDEYEYKNKVIEGMVLVREGVTK